MSKSSSSSIIQNDPRIKHHQTTISGREYHYITASPPPFHKPRGTLLALHGWPDTHHAFRHQIPTLLSLSLNIIVPDLQGYGLSSSPQSLSSYTFKTISDDLALLLSRSLAIFPASRENTKIIPLTEQKVWVLGHDWGGALAYRFALWHPNIVHGLISICTPFAAPQATYVPLSTLVESQLPNFAYQLQLASPDVEAFIGSDPIKIRQFLNAVYGGKTSGDRKEAFTTENGIDLERLKDVQPTRLLSSEEMDYYVELYAKNGVRGPLNWYRTRKLNWEDEVVLTRRRIKFAIPTLFIQATRDAALPPAMSQGMGRFFEDLEVKKVDAGHWALWQSSEECNSILKEWLEKKLGHAKGVAKL